MALRMILTGAKPCCMKSVVEFLQAELGAHLLAVVLAQLQDLQLAQRVNKIRRIGGAALGLASATGRSLVASLTKNSRAWSSVILPVCISMPTM